MTEIVELLTRATLIGIGGAGAMDVWGLVARRAFGIRGLDYALLGRWIGHFPRGHFLHERIAAADPVPGERVLGWIAHYSIGVAFVIPVLVIAEPGWAETPTLGPALLVALVTIIAPWFVMQPAMGAGIAGSRTPNPAAVRLRNLASHMAYGLGLFACAVVVAVVWR